MEANQDGAFRLIQVHDMFSTLINVNTNALRHLPLSRGKNMSNREPIALTSRFIPLNSIGWTPVITIRLANRIIFLNITR